MRTGSSPFLPGLLFCLLTLLTAPGKAQMSNPYQYPDLSHLANLRLRDSLKKNWQAPALYKDKETQKKFRELWDSRTDFMVNAIDQKNFIQEEEVYTYLGGIIDQLQKANAHLLATRPTLLVDRSGSVNAYSMGGHLIAVNLGLVAFVSSREELALIIAHELAHDILGHAEKSMKERSEWLTSAEYKKSLNQVLDSKYERYSRLKKLMEGYTFNRTRHNRYHEGEADSLAVVLLKNSRIPFNPQYFLRLDSADRHYLQPLQKPVKDYFTAFSLPFEESWTQKKSKGLSSRNYNFARPAELADSMKTHPDCQERYERTKALSTAQQAGTPLPASLLHKVNKMIIWNTFDNRQLTACLYRIFQQIDKGATDDWYAFMVFNVFSGLAYSDSQLERFNAINVLAKEYISPSYYELQTLLEQMPREVLEQYPQKLGAQAFWQKLPPDARTLKGLFLAVLDQQATEKTRENAARSFTSSHTGSMYCEFADHFIKK